MITKSESPLAGYYNGCVLSLILWAVVALAFLALKPWAFALAAVVVVVVTVAAFWPHKEHAEGGVG